MGRSKRLCILDDVCSSFFPEYTLHIAEVWFDQVIDSGSGEPLGIIRVEYSITPALQRTHNDV